MKGDSGCPHCFGTGHRRIIEHHRSVPTEHGSFTTNVYFNRKCTYNRKKLRKIRPVEENKHESSTDCTFYRVTFST